MDNQHHRSLVPSVVSIAGFFLPGTDHPSFRVLTRMADGSDRGFVSDLPADVLVVPHALAGESPMAYPLCTQLPMAAHGKSEFAAAGFRLDDGRNAPVLTL